jgi:hypothetical protein
MRSSFFSMKSSDPSQPGEPSTATDFGMMSSLAAKQHYHLLRYEGSWDSSVVLLVERLPVDASDRGANSSPPVWNTLIDLLNQHWYIPQKFKSLPSNRGPIGCNLLALIRHAELHYRREHPWTKRGIFDADSRSILLARSRIHIKDCWHTCPPSGSAIYLAMEMSCAKNSQTSYEPTFCP